MKKNLLKRPTHIFKRCSDVRVLHALRRVRHTCQKRPVYMSKETCKRDLLTFSIAATMCACSTRWEGYDTYINVRTYACVYVCIHIYIYVCIYICTYIYMHIHIHMYVYIYAYTYVYSYIGDSFHVHFCLYVRMI